MNYRFLCLISLMFGLVVTGLYVTSLETSKHLIATNAELHLVVEELQKHPVHDAEITVWKRHDRKLLIVVNGKFGHLIADPCGLAL